MIDAVGSLAILGATLGTLLGIASRYLRVEENPLEAELEAMLPGSQCGQCGYAGCRQAASALVTGDAQVTLCPPGGRALVAALADKLGVEVDLSGAKEIEPEIAFINEDICIGCMRCFTECSTDAIVGAPKQMHTVVAEICHGCAKCTTVCPTEAVEMRPIPVTLASWHWHKPVSRMVH